MIVGNMNHGYRISPYYDLSDVNVAINSLIKINSIKPDGTDLKVFSLITNNTDIPDVDNPGWEEQTNNTALTVINPTENYQNKYLWLKTVLSSNISQTSTPSLQEIEIFVYTAYVESGYRISPSINVGKVKTIDNDTIYWVENTPENTELKDAILNENGEVPPDEDSEDWEEQTNNTSLTVISEGQDLTGKYLWLKQVLSTLDISKTPVLNRLQVGLLSQDQYTGIEEQSPGDRIVIFKTGTFGKLFYGKQELENTLSGELIGRNALYNNWITSNDLKITQKQAGHRKDISFVYDGTPVTKTVDLNENSYYIVMCKVSSTNNL